MGDSPHYLFPRNPNEVDRLDIQHYSLKATLGADFLAPISHPHRVLDVGAGTGQWGFDLLRRFPGCVVVGLDLVPPKQDRPAGYRFVKANLIRGLPFDDDQFDFVHQRLLSAGVPLASWPPVVADLARVTRPGGWVELVEFPWDMEGTGPAFEELLELSRRMSADAGLDPRRQVVDSLQRFLERAGLGTVSLRDIPLPVGPWGGQVGSLMATNMRTGFTRLTETMRDRGMISETDAWEKVQTAAREVAEGRVSWTGRAAFARKPLRRVHPVGPSRSPVQPGGRSGPVRSRR